LLLADCTTARLWLEGSKANFCWRWIHYCYLEGYNDSTVKSSSNGTEGGRNFFRCRQVPFNTVLEVWIHETADPRNSKSFPLKTGFFMPRFPLKQIPLHINLGSLVSGLCFVHCLLFQTRRFGDCKFSFFFYARPNSNNSIYITNYVTPFDFHRAWDKL
jgi:hypothetical protein